MPGGVSPSFGVVITIIMLTRKWRGAIILGILFTTVLAIILNYAYDKAPFVEATAVMPTRVFALPDFSLVGAFDFGAFAKLGVTAAILWIFSLMLSDFFDTMGTLVGVGGQAGYLDEKGDLPEVNRPLLVDSVAAIGRRRRERLLGHHLHRVRRRGRSGRPHRLGGDHRRRALPGRPCSSRRSPASCRPRRRPRRSSIVGYLMMATLTKAESEADHDTGEPKAAIDFGNLAFGLPAVLIMTIMPLTYSITNGIGFGFIAYTLIRVVQGKAREVSWMLWIATRRLPHLLPRPVAPGHRAGSDPPAQALGTRLQKGRAAARRPAPSAILAAVMSVVLLIIALAIILASAELFTNGVEWFGRRYELGEGAVGSVLAAVGTALPETLVPIIAIVFTGGQAADDIGIGAILGRRSCWRAWRWSSPRRRSWSSRGAGAATLAVVVNEEVMRRDLSHFLIAYALAMGAGLIHVRALHYALAVGLIAFYGYYVWETLRSEGDLEGETRPLYFHRHPEMPHRYRIFLQIGVALAGHRPRRRDLRAGDRDAQRDARRRAPHRVRCSSRRSPPSCRRSSTRCSGSASARTRWPSATSPGPWCSRAPSRCRWACSSRPGN